MWRLAACLDEQSLGVNKARSMLEVARLRNPKQEGLWLEAVRLERRAGNDKGAGALMAKALQECPGSGVLWAEEILVAQRAEQKSESKEGGGRGGGGGYKIEVYSAFSSCWISYPQSDQTRRCKV